MHTHEHEYTADDLIIKIVCSELISEHELSIDFQPMLCRWAVEVLNSYDETNDITRLLLTARIARALEQISGAYH